MKILGFEITRSGNKERALSGIYGQNTWSRILGMVQEPFTGAWQRNIIQDNTTLLAFSAVYACVTGIASDIAKLRIKLTKDNQGIWEEITKNSPWLPLLRRPNHYQVRFKFSEQWILSKLLHGNTYVLKERDERGIVNSLYVLNPLYVIPLLSDSGDLFYDLKEDKLNQVFGQVVIPASEIIHDTMPGLFHPLVGTSPLYACAVTVQMGDSIQSNSSYFFRNYSQPGGMLTAPGRINDETAARMKREFEKNFSGRNLGRLFVGGDGLEFKPFQMTAEQAQLVEQLKWSVSDVARAFHYPEYKLGGPLPPYSGNMQALTLAYYTDCLQPLIESMEDHLDKGLELPLGQATELDVDNLLRMDSQGMAEVVSKVVGAGVMAPNEARFKYNLPAVTGGQSPYLQQQNYSLAALAKRDSQEDPFGLPKTEPQLPPVDEPEELEDDDTERGIWSLNLRAPEDISGQI